MEDCENCKALKDAKNILYEDAVCVAVMPEDGATLGHIKVFPKKHVHTFDNIPDDISNHLFFVASNAAMGVFEAIGAHGTNIIVNNGIDDDREHLTIHVIPRKNSDGLDFTWKPKPADGNELDEVKERINQHTQFITSQEAQKIRQRNTEPLTKEDEETDPQEELLLKTLDRIP